VYRIAERGEVHVLTGYTAVEAFYRRVAVDRMMNVMAARALNICVADFGVITEAVWNHITPGAMMQPGQGRPRSGRALPCCHNIMQNFAYDHDAKLIGERVYDDPASYRHEKLNPGDVVTPEMARQQLAPFLARAMLK
jgi:hypothetical protein